MDSNLFSDLFASFPVISGYNFKSKDWKKTLTFDKKIEGLILRILSPLETLRENTQREKCPYLELFWSVFYRIRAEYGEIRSIFPYLVRMRENAGQNNSEYGHFFRSDKDQQKVPYWLATGIWK